MKKLRILICITLVSVTFVCAEDVDQNVQKEIALQHNASAWHEVLDVEHDVDFECNDEYMSCDSDSIEVIPSIDSSIQEYDQHICDHVTNPEISDTMALLREFGITVLIKLFAAKERIALCYAHTKDRIFCFLGLVTGAKDDTRET